MHVYKMLSKRRQQGSDEPRSLVHRGSRILTGGQRETPLPGDLAQDSQLDGQGSGNIRVTMGRVS